MEPLADILLNYEVSINLFVQLILFLLLSTSFIKTLYILKHYKFNTATQLQYSLEKSSYLVISILYVVLIIKALLLPYFIFTLDTLSEIIPGAMCGAGVISANEFGEPLLGIKIFIVIISMLWLTLNKEDLHSKNFKYFKKKMYLFLVIYLFICIEAILEILFFTSLTTLNPVSCCSSLYANSQESNPLPFDISILTLIVSFYGSYLLILTASYFKRKMLLAILSIFFLYISYYSIVYFFSTYIYQLPTHKCPYCLVQSEYSYIGYFIYSSLLFATFYALKSSFFKFPRNSHKTVVVSYTLFIFFSSIDFLYYIIVNKTLL